MFKVHPVAYCALLFAGMFVLGACSSIPFLMKAQDRIVSGVKTYCNEPLIERQAIRQSVNTALSGTATICVQCKGDPADPSCVAPQ